MIATEEGVGRIKTIEGHKEAVKANKFEQTISKQLFMSRLAFSDFLLDERNEWLRFTQKCKLCNVIFAYDILNIFPLAFFYLLTLNGH